MRLQLIFQFTYVQDCNERENFMQETQHTQQTATQTAQNQDNKIT